MTASPEVTVQILLRACAHTWRAIWELQGGRPRAAFFCLSASISGVEAASSRSPANCAPASQWVHLGSMKTAIVEVLTPQEFADYTSGQFGLVSFFKKLVVYNSQCTTGDDKGAGSEKWKNWKKNLWNCKTFFFLAFLTLSFYTKAGNWQLNTVCCG